MAVIGALTLLIAGFSALAQSDIKRVLAYSTISQIGYMFLALGVGAWSAGIFHFMTHAFFKALLFLAAGVVILALHHEQDMFKMGGLRKRLPLAFWTFLIGAASLAALPLVTAGFYSKDLILEEAWASRARRYGAVAGGLVGALLTALHLPHGVPGLLRPRASSVPTWLAGPGGSTMPLVIAGGAVAGGRLRRDAAGRWAAAGPSPDSWQRVCLPTSLAARRPSYRDAR